MAARRGTPEGTGVTVHPGELTSRSSIPALILDLAGGSAELIRQELRLLRLELGALLSNVARGALRVAIGGVLLLLGALAALAGLIFLIGQQWIVGQYWLAALIVCVIAGAAAAVFAARGARLLAPHRLVPTETIASLKEDSEWLKHPLTSDATSR